MAVRDGLIVGPARYVFDSASFYSADDVTVNINESTVQHVARGMQMDSFITDATVGLTVKPDGQLTSAIISALWPYLTSYSGEGVGTSTQAMTIHDSNSHLHTVANAIVTSMPSLHFGLEDTIIGPVGFTGIRTVAATAWTAGTLYSAAVSGGTFADATWTSPVRQEYTATITSATGFTTAFHSKGGFRVRVNTNINLHSGPVLGTFMGSFVSADVMVEFEPSEQTALVALTALASQGAAAIRGTSATTLGQTLVITGETNTAYTFTLPKAVLVGGNFNFGTSSGFLRNGVFGMLAARTLTSGVPDTLFTLAIA